MASRSSVGAEFAKAPELTRYPRLPGFRREQQVTKQEFLMLNVSSGSTGISTKSHEIHDELRKCERASFAAIRTLWVKPGANSVVVDDIIVENYKYFISYVHTQKFPNRRPLLALVNLGDITTTIERRFRCRLAGLQCWNQLAANWIHLLACQSKAKHTKWIQFNLITYQLQILEKKSIKSIHYLSSLGLFQAPNLRRHDQNYWMQSI